MTEQVLSLSSFTKCAASIDLKMKPLKSINTKRDDIRLSFLIIKDMVTEY